MTLKIFSENKEQKIITFEILNNNTSAYKGRELIVVNYGCQDEILAYKKALIAETLYMFAYEKRGTDWKELDEIIADIMNIKIHLI